MSHRIRGRSLSHRMGVSAAPRTRLLSSSMACQKRAKARKAKLTKNSPAALACDQRQVLSRESAMGCALNIFSGAYRTDQLSAVTMRHKVSTSTA